MLYFTPDKKIVKLKEVSEANDYQLPSELSILLIKQFAQAFFVVSELSLECRIFVLN